MLFIKNQIKSKQLYKTNYEQQHKKVIASEYKFDTVYVYSYLMGLLLTKQNKNKHNISLQTDSYQIA